MRRILLCAAALLLAGGLAMAQEQKGGEKPEKPQDFSFYGIHFRMTKEQVQKILPTNPEGTEAQKPGHGMMFLTFTYDYRGRLMEMRAAYPRLEDPLADEGLRRALKERFVLPISGKYKNLSVNLDDFSNRAAITLVILSLDVKEEVINYYKEEALKKFD